MEQSPAQRIFFSAASVLCGLALAALIGEGALRALGKKTFRHGPALGTGFFDRDAELGWIPGVGEHDVYVFSIDARVRMTILPDGSRKTSEHTPDAPEILLVGGSFTFGLGLADSDSLAWNLQESDPAHHYVNRAVSAYGAYQSLLVMEARLDQQPPPAAVLYGFIRHHEIRNIAHGPWVTDLLRSDQGGKTPYCDIDESGALLRFPPAGLSPVPFREFSALMNLLDGQFNRVRTRSRLMRRLEVQHAIFRAMDDACRRVGTRFAVLLLDQLGEEIPEIEPLKRDHIAYADLRTPHPQELRLPGDVHPNPKLIAIWADELRPFIDRLLQNDPAPESSGPPTERPL